MIDVACRYSRSELELCGLKKSLRHFQYLLKYLTFTVLMNHSALKRIYCSCKPAKMICIQKFLKEISDFSFDFQHISDKHMFVSDFLSCFSSENNDEELIPYLIDTSLLNNASYMTQLDAICKFNYNKCQGKCTSHSSQLLSRKRKCWKLQFQVYLNLAQARQDQLPKPAFFEIYQLCSIGKCKRPKTFNDEWKSKTCWSTWDACKNTTKSMSTM